jgi:hypothetical protein
VRDTERRDGVAPWLGYVRLAALDEQFDTPLEHVEDLVLLMMDVRRRRVAGRAPHFDDRHAPTGLFTGHVHDDQVAQEPQGLPDRRGFTPRHLRPSALDQREKPTSDRPSLASRETQSLELHEVTGGSSRGFGESQRSPGAAWLADRSRRTTSGRNGPSALAPDYSREHGQGRVSP